MELVLAVVVDHTPGDAVGRSAGRQPAGCRPPVSHHMKNGSMLPEAMGYIPSLPDRNFHRGWEPERVDVVRPRQMLVPPVWKPDSQRSITPPSSYRSNTACRPITGSYSTSSGDIGLEVSHAAELRAHESRPQTATDPFRRAVGGVLPGYSGHVPNAQTHFGRSHVGGVVTSAAVNGLPAHQRHQRDHGEHATRMEQEPSSEIAGRAATRVAAGSIVGYAGHLPGHDLGAFGTSHWNRDDWKAPPTPHGWRGGPSPPTSHRHLKGQQTGSGSRQRVPAGFRSPPPRMANLDLYA